MTDTMTKATQIWEELRKNPDSFEKVAKLKSMDTSTRALGGMLPEPIARYANPKAVSKTAFEQLVDGDPRDPNPAHKPKDGDITGPIQVNESAWLIMKREELHPRPAPASSKTPGSGAGSRPRSSRSSSARRWKTPSARSTRPRRSTTS